MTIVLGGAGGAIEFSRNVVVEGSVAFGINSGNNILVVLVVIGPPGCADSGLDLCGLDWSLTLNHITANLALSRVNF